MAHQVFAIQRIHVVAYALGIEKFAKAVALHQVGFIIYSLRLWPHPRPIQQCLSGSGLATCMGEAGSNSLRNSGVDG